jgi:hypothetical protein
MRSQFASRTGLVLIKSPSARQQSTRRRLAVVCGVLALALASGLIGSLTHSDATQVGRTHTGPFSYFPSQ